MLPSASRAQEVTKWRKAARSTRQSVARLGVMSIPDGSHDRPRRARPAGPEPRAAAGARRRARARPPAALGARRRGAQHRRAAQGRRAAAEHRHGPARPHRRAPALRRRPGRPRGRRAGLRARTPRCPRCPSAWSTRPSSAACRSSACAAACPFVEVTEAVHSAILAGQLALLRRGEEIHQRFTALMLDGEGVDQVLRVLADTIADPVVLEDARGELLFHARHRTPDGDVVAAWETLQAAAATASRTRSTSRPATRAAPAGSSRSASTPPSTTSTAWRSSAPRASSRSPVAAHEPAAAARRCASAAASSPSSPRAICRRATPPPAPRA